jgi:diacylglycerol kinase family enzyme
VNSLSILKFKCKMLSETKHRLHAQEIAHSLDLQKYDGIICVSGDGILVEVSKIIHMHMRRAASYTLFSILRYP